ncbi:hypothetical protein [Lutibacter sp.]|uniref:hypothetical protein n=1 Tax=Lutibacter sp. TaxID=1925666 RepID=UPI0027375163|nr:hypothetical protein [Lutibacter sp.]MDP3314161.1 hypothetical protein [Lutibacter sp.]
MILITLSNSCQSQDKTEPIVLSYSAQTRGFQLGIQLENNALEVLKNNETKNVELTNNQFAEIIDLVSKIDFNTIKSNLSIEDLAVDKAIKGEFSIRFKNKDYTFDFDHNNAPKSIYNLLQTLQNFTLLEK